MCTICVIPSLISEICPRGARSWSAVPKTSIHCGARLMRLLLPHGSNAPLVSFNSVGVRSASTERSVHGHALAGNGGHGEGGTARGERHRNGG